MRGRIVSEWQDVPLADLCASIDYGVTASASAGPGPKFLRITDIVPSAIDWNRVPRCDIDDRKTARFALERDDIVVARTGATVGYAKRIRQLPGPAVFASYLVRFRVTEDHDAAFVGHVVESLEFKEWVAREAGGRRAAKCERTNARSLPRVGSADRAPTSDCVRPRRLRRAHCGQRAAHRVARRHRALALPRVVRPVPVPGARPCSRAHPRRLGADRPRRDCEVVIRRNAEHEEPDYWDGGIPWITSGSLRGMLLSSSERTLTAAGVNAGSRTVDRDAVLFVVRGMSLFGRCEPASQTERWRSGRTARRSPRLKGSSRCFSAFTVLDRQEAMHGMVELAGHGTGKLSTDRVKAIPVLLPPPDVQREFVAVVSPIRDAIATALDAVGPSADTRDLLLPRLVTGRLDISDVDLGDLLARGPRDPEASRSIGLVERPALALLE